jgi:hypothetical protein
VSGCVEALGKQRTDIVNRVVVHEHSLGRTRSQQPSEQLKVAIYISVFSCGLKVVQHGADHTKLVDRAPEFLRSLVWIMHRQSRKGGETIGMFRNFFCDIAARVVGGLVKQTFPTISRNGNDGALIRLSREFFGRLRICEALTSGRREAQNLHLDARFVHQLDSPLNVDHVLCEPDGGLGRGIIDRLVCQSWQIPGFLENYIHVSAGAGRGSPGRAYLSSPSCFFCCLLLSPV